ncbi:MAG: toll/interleukin-1 receptor domain-containing protein [Flavobacteriaceae bacterium]
MKRYILFIRTPLLKYNIIGIDLEGLKYIMHEKSQGKNDFMLGGSRYFINDLLNFNIYDFETNEKVDEFLRLVKIRKLKQKTLYGEEFIGRDTLSQFGTDVSSKFLDSKNEIEINKNSKKNKSMIDVFISHSSADQNKVKLLINILRSALNLSKERIRCTSVPGYKLSGGSNTDETLKQEIVDCNLFIAVLTENSIKSTYVLFELGARWGLDKTLKPLVCEKNMSTVVKGPLSGIHCLNGTEASEIIQLVEECGKTLNISPSSTDVYLDEAIEFAEMSSSNSVPKKKEDERVEVKYSLPKAYSRDESIIKNEIQQNTQGEYPDDYSTQEYVMEEQFSAFQKLKSPPENWKSLSEYEKIVTRVVKEHPDDYTTQLYVIEEQVASLLRLKQSNAG